jgi:hypothetical protein
MSPRFSLFVLTHRKKELEVFQYYAELSVDPQSQCRTRHAFCYLGRHLLQTDNKMMKLCPTESGLTRVEAKQTENSNNERLVRSPLTLEGLLNEAGASIYQCTDPEEFKRFITPYKKRMSRCQFKRLAFLVEERYGARFALQAGFCVGSTRLSVLKPPKG